MIKISDNVYAGVGDDYLTSAMPNGTVYVPLDNSPVQMKVDGVWVMTRASANEPITSERHVACGRGASGGRVKARSTARRPISAAASQ